MSRIPNNKKAHTIIYTLSHPITGEIRYIGKTVVNLKKRLSDHIYSCSREKNYRCNWIKSITKLGLKPIITSIEECRWDESQFLEKYWISQFRAWGFNLVNSTDGGEGNLGRKPSKQNIENLKKANSKKVYQYTLEGEFIREFSSCTEAAKYVGLANNSKIAMVARGERKKAGGYKWSYNKLVIYE